MDAKTDSGRGHVILSGRTAVGRKTYTVLAVWDKRGANADEARDALEGITRREAQ